MNEDQRTTEYLNSLKNVSLRKEVRFKMREELAAYADLHSVRMTEESRSIAVSQKNSVFTSITNMMMQHMKATIAIMLMVGLGGTSAAASNSLPGEFLYPVKVSVNERVASALTFGAEADAALEAKLLTERLEEAETLAAKGELNGDLALSVEEGINSQYARSQESAVTAGTELNVDLSTRVAMWLQNSTEGDGTLLASESGSDASADARLSKFGDSSVNSDSGVSMMMTTELAGEIDVSTIVTGAKARLEALQKTIAAATDMEAKARAEFKTKLDTAAKLVTTAEVALTANAEAEAETEAQKANELLGEVESALSLMGQVEIDPNTGHIIDIDLSTPPLPIPEGAYLETEGGADVDAAASGLIDL